MGVQVNKPPFVVFCLPRSRSAWTTFYLSYWSQLNVGHDTAMWCDRPEDFVVNFQSGMAGSVETGAVVGWRLIKEIIPGARFAVIKRPVEEVKRSLSQFGITPVNGELEERARMLNTVSQHPGVLTLTFAELYDQQNRKALFEHCTGLEFDPQWDATVAHRNVQIDVFERMHHLSRRRNQIETLKASLN